MPTILARDDDSRLIDWETGTAGEAHAHPELATADHAHAAGSHPDLATHTALGLAAAHGHDYAVSVHAHAEYATDADLAAHAATPHGGGSIPAGIIVMWGGLLANIPSGWVLCDGTNGTPDLRSRFVKGAAADPGATGGAATHTHATHVSAGAHAHDAHTAGRKGGTSNPLDIFNAPQSHASDGAHTHDAHDNVNHEPAYYALAFIQKT